MVVACLTLGLTVAAEPGPPIEPVGARKGLAADSFEQMMDGESINAIHATDEGVNRLNRDGRTFRRYSDAIRPVGAPVMVSALAATPSGSLWIGTFGIGLLVLDIRDVPGLLRLAIRAGLVSPEA
jgi:hypothetical protein